MRNETVGLDDLRAWVDRLSRRLGRRLKFVLGKPGLDGHSNGAEQIAVRARDAGMDIFYDGIRLTPAQIVEAAQSQNAHVVGLSILSGSHLALVQDVVARLRTAGLGHIPVVVGGIIPRGCPEARATRHRGGIYAQRLRSQSGQADVLRIVEAAAESNCRVG
jgi:(2R)-ethylmalonyl-CoA mutase